MTRESHHVPNMGYFLLACCLYIDVLLSLASPVPRAHSQSQGALKEMIKSAANEACLVSLIV